MRPRVIVFDLDGTLWNPEMYELHGGAPFKHHPTRHDALIDRAGTTVALIGEARSVLQRLFNDPSRTSERERTYVAISSTCDEPAWARECLSKLFLDDDRKVPLSTLFGDLTEIYASNKAAQMQTILGKIRRIDTTVTDFHQFVFFDNQQNNIRDVSPLGVASVYCPGGLEVGVFERGLRQWAEKKSSKV